MLLSASRNLKTKQMWGLNNFFKSKVNFHYQVWNYKGSLQSPVGTSFYRYGLRRSSASFSRRGGGNQDFYWEEGKGMLGKCQRQAPPLEGHLCLPPYKSGDGRRVSLHPTYRQGTICPHSAADLGRQPVDSTPIHQGSAPGEAFIFWNIITHNLKFKIDHQSQPGRCSYVLTCWGGGCAEDKEAPGFFGARNWSQVVKLLVAIVWLLETDLVCLAKHDRCYHVIITSSFHLLMVDHVCLISMDETSSWEIKIFI